MDGAADALRWERTSRGLNPDEAAAVLRSIARRLGVRADDIDGDSVLRWEMGGPLPTRVLRLISAAFDVPFLDLAGLTDHGYQAHWLEFSPGGVRVLREERNGMLRRDFLRYIGGLAVGGLADHERMAYALANIGRLDGRLVGDLEHLTAEYGDRMWTTAPARLLPVLRGHLTVLRQLMTGAAGQPWAGVLQLAG